jgi:ribA/ribD-fused uncharacterized protein
MKNKIERFAGQYNFLSNFEKCAVEYEGVVYQSVEAAYQAAKTLDHDARVPFETYAPGEAKKAGKKLELRPNWETLRFDVMYQLVKQKFSFEPHRSKLLDTGDAELIEGNYWMDRVWGVYRGFGENHLGKILMRVRKELQSEGGCSSMVEPRSSKPFTGVRFASAAPKN